jgi:hypothetical protein
MKIKPPKNRKQGMKYLAANAADKDELEFAQETEGEMDGPDGKTKVRSKMKNMRINEDVEFEWIKPKIRNKK